MEKHVQWVSDGDGGVVVHCQMREIVVVKGRGLTLQQVWRLHQLQGCDGTAGTVAGVDVAQWMMMTVVLGQGDSPPQLTDHQDGSPGGQTKTGTKKYMEVWKCVNDDDDGRGIQ